MSIKLIKGDCLIEMQKIESGSVDAIITDPPYGTTACKWDSVIDFKLMWEQLNRIIKPNGAIVLFGSEPFSSALRMSNIKNYKYDWIWDKHIPRNFANAKRMPMNKHEIISVFNCKGFYYPQMILRDKPVTVKNYSKKGKDSSYKINKDGSNDKTYTYTHRNPDTIIVGKWMANKGKQHPTQKPVSLMEYLIKTYTNENETVLDFTMGSGSTMVACQSLNRNGIGIEMDEKYFNIATKRIKENEYKLFK
jgi:site-specific DNA-methyltransferase (adenine-specific)